MQRSRPDPQPRRPHQSHKPHSPWVVAGLLALVAAALVGGLWLPDRTIDAGDMLIFFPSEVHAPWQGTIDPAVMAGAPALPNPETGGWYPPAWLLALSWFKGLPVYIFLHLWLGGMGVWSWTRRHSRSPWGPLIAAVAWMSCGPTWSLLTKLSALPGAAMLPWALYGVDQLTGNARARGVTIIALAVAISWYGGAPECVVLTAAVSLLWSLSRPHSSRHGAHSLWVPALRVPALTATALGIGAGLCLALLVPLLTLLPTTTRANGLDFATATAMSTPVRDWLRVLVADPDWLGPLGQLSVVGQSQHWLVSLYAGLFALGLGLLGLRRRGAWAAALPIAVFVLLALGEHNPLYAWFHRLPLVGTIRYPEKWWLGAVPFGVWLVAVGTPRAPRNATALLVLVTIEGLLSTHTVFDLARISESFAPGPTIRAIVADAHAQSDVGGDGGNGLPVRTWSDSVHHQPGLPTLPGEPLHRTVHSLVYPNVGARFGLHALYGSWALRSTALDAWVQQALRSDLPTRHAMLRSAGVAYWIVWDQSQALEIATATGLRPVPAVPGDNLTVGVLAEPQPLPLVRRADGAPVLAQRVKPGRWTVQTDGPGPSRLRLAVAWAPGWSARIDGGPSQPLPALADSPWIELPLPPGPHDLVLSYWPAGLKPGLAGTGLSLLLLLLLRRRLKRSRPGVVGG